MNSEGKLISWWFSLLEPPGPERIGSLRSAVWTFIQQALGKYCWMKVDQKFSDSSLLFPPPPGPYNTVGLAQGLWHWVVKMSHEQNLWLVDAWPGRQEIHPLGKIWLGTPKLAVLVNMYWVSFIVMITWQIWVISYPSGKGDNPPKTHYSSKVFLLLPGMYIESPRSHTKERYLFLRSLHTNTQMVPQPIPCCLF